jgi:hypothetical protein
MKLIPVKSQKLEHLAYFQFLQQFVALVNKYDATKLKLTSALLPLVAFFTHLEAALNKEVANKLTQILNRLDAERDLLISGFIQFLESMCKYPDAAIAASAKSLLAYVNSFGKGIAEQNQLSETTTITQIVNEFTNNADRKTALAAMHGTLWITALGTVNTEFAAQYGNRVTDTTTNDKVVSFTEQKKAVVPAYNELVDLIEGRYKTAKSDGLDLAPYETLIADLNKLITNVNMLADTPKSKNDTPKDGSGGGK